MRTGAEPSPDHDCLRAEATAVELALPPNSTVPQTLIGVALLCMGLAGCAALPAVGLNLAAQGAQGLVALTLGPMVAMQESSETDRCAVFTGKGISINESLETVIPIDEGEVNVFEQVEWRPEFAREGYPQFERSRTPTEGALAITGRSVCCPARGYDKHSRSLRIGPGRGGRQKCRHGRASFHDREIVLRALRYRHVRAAAAGQRGFRDDHDGGCSTQGARGRVSCHGRQLTPSIANGRLRCGLPTGVLCAADANAVPASPRAPV